jgi:hypothetical protein
MSEHGNTTRVDIGVGGEYVYGFVMMPEDTVFAIMDAFWENYHGCERKLW